METLMEDVEEYQDKQNNDIFGMTEQDEQLYKKICKKVDTTEKRKFTSIVCFNMTEYKFYVYS